MGCIRTSIITLAVLFALGGSALAQTEYIRIIHTNDLHSSLLGFSPNLDYTPLNRDGDKTVGGWARIATVIKEKKASARGISLVLDAGDFLMGSLFHMVSREEALELRLLKMMGYDATTLGNHEFDLRPDGLARMLSSAKGRMPEIVLSNIVFDKGDKRDDSLEAHFKNNLVKPYVVLTRGKIKIGIFGLMGVDAAEKAPFASPVSFSDVLETARRMVDILRNKENVDIVICLSHSGLTGKQNRSEDVTLAREVDGIDVIISGHSHTILEKPIVENDTYIVQAWESGRQVGVLDLSLDMGRLSLQNYEIVDINDDVLGDEWINDQIESFIDLIEYRVLRNEGLNFFQTIAQTDFDLKITKGESTLGNLLTDSMRWAVDRDYDSGQNPMDRVSVAVQSNGVMRSHILKGKTGKIITSDIFRAVPLGIGFDGESMVYPIVSFYLLASEIKKATEIMASVAPLKDDDYLLQVSGIKIKHNPYRMIFDRVVDIWMEDQWGDYAPLDYSNSNKQLYKVVTNIYNAAFLKMVGDFTWGILTIVPKNRDGSPIKDLKDARVDENPYLDGIQEMKEWKVLIEYTAEFRDTDGDGIPEIPERYREPEGRIVKSPSLNPLYLVVRPSYMTWLAIGAFLLMVGLLVLAGFGVKRIVRRNKKDSPE